MSEEIINLPQVVEVSTLGQNNRTIVAPKYIFLDDEPHCVQEETNKCTIFLDLSEDGSRISQSSCVSPSWQVLETDVFMLKGIDGAGGGQTTKRISITGVSKDTFTSSNDSMDSFGLAQQFRERNDLLRRVIDSSKIKNEDLTAYKAHEG